jgi:hypothetical protein
MIGMGAGLPSYTLTEITPADHAAASVNPNPA